MQGSKQSGKRAAAGRSGALANHHGAWPHVSAKQQENHVHDGKQKRYRLERARTPGHGP